MGTATTALAGFMEKSNIVVIRRQLGLIMATDTTTSQVQDLMLTMNIKDKVVALSTAPLAGFMEKMEKSNIVVMIGCLQLGLIMATDTTTSQVQDLILTMNIKDDVVMALSTALLAGFMEKMEKSNIVVMIGCLQLGLIMAISHPSASKGARDCKYITTGTR